MIVHPEIHTELPPYSAVSGGPHSPGSASPEGCMSGYSLHIGSGALSTGASGTSGSNLMPEPIGFHVLSKLGIGLHVSCVQSSCESLLSQSASSGQSAMN